MKNTPNQENTVIIPADPTEKCIAEIRKAILDTGAMGLRHASEAVYRAVVNHGSLKQGD